jgi:hypothetical protein
MEAAPSYRVNPQLSRSIKPMKIKHTVRTCASRRAATKTTRKNDPVYFTDINYVSDYTGWLKDSIDPTIQLAVKGPISQLSYAFEKLANGQVISTTKPFGSPADAEIPIILPDYSSDFYRNRAKSVRPNPTPMEENTLTGDFEDDADDEMQAVQAMYRQSNLGNDGEHNLEADHNIKNSLGLNAFYLINTEDKLNFRISAGTVNEEDLKIADFAEDQRAQHGYHYATSLLNSEDYRADKKADIREWLKTVPPAPTNKKSGFAKGDAERWVGANYINGLKPVLELAKQVERPTMRAYADAQSTGPCWKRCRRFATDHWLVIPTHLVKPS